MSPTIYLWSSLRFCPLSIFLQVLNFAKVRFIPPVFSDIRDRNHALRTLQSGCGSAVSYKICSLWSRLPASGTVGLVGFKQEKILTNAECNVFKHDQDRRVEDVERGQRGGRVSRGRNWMTHSHDVSSAEEEWNRNDALRSEVIHAVDLPWTRR